MQPLTRAAILTNALPIRLILPKDFCLHCYEIHDYSYANSARFATPGKVFKLHSLQGLQGDLRGGLGVLVPAAGGPAQTLRVRHGGAPPDDLPRLVQPKVR